jgi:hypothetical protein
MRALARAQSKKKVFAKAVVQVVDTEFVLALIAQQFQHRWSALFGGVDIRTVDVDHVHLQRLDKKLLVVAAG